MMKCNSTNNIFYVLQMPFSDLMNVFYLRNVSLAIVIGWLSVIRADAYEYEADGILDGENFVVSGRVVKEEAVSFKVYVRDCQWLIHITQQNAHTKYMEVGFDGNTMYYSSMLDEKLIADVKPKPPLWAGGLSFDVVPFNGSVPNMPVVWLALASSCYLNDAKSNLIPAYSTDEIRASMPAIVVRMNDALKLPQSIIYLDDGFDWHLGTPHKRQPPYDTGFTNAIYSVNVVTNIGGYVLPRQFTLDVFLAASTGIAPYTKYNGIVNNARAECSLTNFIPETGGVGFMNDFRFVSTDATRKTGFYYHTNRWMNTNEVEALTSFSNYTIMERREKNEPAVGIVHGNEVNATASPAALRVVRCFLYAFIFGSGVVFILLCFRYNNKRNI